MSIRLKHPQVIGNRAKTKTAVSSILVLGLFLLFSPVLAAKMVKYPDLVPAYLWTGGCTPTAAAMAIGYWDNYVPGTGKYAGYGKLIDYYREKLKKPWDPWHPKYNPFNNIPNLLLELRTAFKTDSEGNTSTSNISRGIKRVTNNTDYNNSYSFSSTQTMSWWWNDWCWSAITNEIDNNRPFIWSVITTGSAKGSAEPKEKVGHSLCAFGYTDDKFVINYNGWDTKKHSWYYKQYNNRYSATRTYVHTIVKGGSNYPNDLIIWSPNGGETWRPGQRKTIWWYHWGSRITRVRIRYSRNGGASWNSITYRSSTPGWNSYYWSIPWISSIKARIRIDGLNDAYQLIAADGSHGNFTISQTSRTYQEMTQAKFGLSQNYPNPFNPETTIEYDIDKDCHVTMKIYNMAGQLIKTLVDEYQTTGHRTITWYGDTDAGQEVASGVYFYRIKAGDFVSTKKMVVLK